MALQECHGRRRERGKEEGNGVLERRIDNGVAYCRMMVKKKKKKVG